MSDRVLWAEAGIAGGVILALIITITGQWRFKRREQAKFARLIQLRGLMESHGLTAGEAEVTGRGRQIVRRIVLLDETGRELAKIGASSSRPDVYLVDSDGALQMADGSEAGLTRLVYLALAEREIPVRESELDRLFEQNG